MLEDYYLKPTSVDKIRNSWLIEPIEKYVQWMVGKQYSASSITRRIPVLIRFAEHAWSQGARTTDDLPIHIQPFVDDQLSARKLRGKNKEAKRVAYSAIQTPIKQLVQLVATEYTGNAKSALVQPFDQQAPGFFDYLSEERGLTVSSIKLYTHNLRRFERYLSKINLSEFNSLTPVILSGFVTDAGQQLCKSAMCGVCTHLRIFLRFLHREALIYTDLSACIDRPRVYRLSTIPRSITWDEVSKTLDAIDQRSATGKRDYAMLLLLVTYGLRAREVAALTLDDIDWKRGRLSIPDRKAGHNTAFPLSPTVGDAIVAYLQHARPTSNQRALFLCCVAPFGSVNHKVVAERAARYLRIANVAVPRPGSHTFRHSCAQRLLDSQFPLKNIGDYLGHAHPMSTQPYIKIDVEGLREIALGDGEVLV